MQAGYLLLGEGVNISDRGDPGGKQDLIGISAPDPGDYPLVGEELLRLPPATLYHPGQRLDRELWREGLDTRLSDLRDVDRIGDDVHADELHRAVLDQAEILPVGERDDEAGRLGQAEIAPAQDEPAGEHQVDDEVEIRPEGEDQMLPPPRDPGEPLTDEGIDGRGHRL